MEVLAAQKLFRQHLNYARYHLLNLQDASQPLAAQASTQALLFALNQAWLVYLRSLLNRPDLQRMSDVLGLDIPLAKGVTEEVVSLLEPQTWLGDLSQVIDSLNFAISDWNKPEPSPNIISSTSSQRAPHWSLLPAQKLNTYIEHSIELIDRHGATTIEY